MANNLYSNLPASTNSTPMMEAYDSLYTKPLELEAGIFDAMKGFFSSRGFADNAAETIAVIIIKQSKIDNYKPMVILDTLKGLDNVEISALVAEILNYNRFKSSFLGYARQFNPSSEITRNIIA